LKASDQRVSIRTIVKIVQLSEGALKQYPKVKAIWIKLYKGIVQRRFTAAFGESAPKMKRPEEK